MLDRMPDVLPFFLSLSLCLLLSLCLSLSLVCAFPSALASFCYDLCQGHLEQTVRKKLLLGVVFTFLLFFSSSKNKYLCLCVRGCVCGCVYVTELLELFSTSKNKKVKIVKMLKNILEM